MVEFNIVLALIKASFNTYSLLAKDCVAKSVNYCKKLQTVSLMIVTIDFHNLLKISCGLPVIFIAMQYLQNIKSLLESKKRLYVYM